MHIQKVDADEGFYATAWCGEKLGMLDRYYLSVDNALKAIENKVGEFPCQQCLSNVITSTQQGVEADEGDSTDEEEFTNPYPLSGEELERTEALLRSR